MQYLFPLNHCFNAIKHIIQEVINAVEHFVLWCTIVGGNNFKYIIFIFILKSNQADMLVWKLRASMEQIFSGKNNEIHVTVQFSHILFSVKVF